MKERWLGFVFCAIFLAVGYNVLIDRLHARFFASSLDFQVYWYIPLLIVPAALLLGLAWLMGFYRKNSERRGDALAALTAALIVYLTLGAGYSCWHYCF